MNVVEDLEWRGLVADRTDPEELTKRLVSGPIVLYCGFDPYRGQPARGQLVPLLALRRFHCSAIIRSPWRGAPPARSAIPAAARRSGNCSRKRCSRTIFPRSRRVTKLLDFETKTNPARLMDNAVWTEPVSFLDFLRDVGKHFSVNQMVAKESVRARMEDRECGITYTEFSYMLLQAFDFHLLCRDHNCELQIGGSDQWGNITAGIELTRKKLGRQVFGLTLPLITNADGTKFGKSLGGAIYLDPAKTSVYRFYQFWIRTDDRDVIRYLKYFTFLSREEIEHGAATPRKPGARAAQTRANAATTIHGPGATPRMREEISWGDLAGVSERPFRDCWEVPTKESREQSRAGQTVWSAGPCWSLPSKGRAKDLKAAALT